MRKKLILLTSVSLAVMLGGTSALAQTETESDEPQGNTVFVAVVDEHSLEGGVDLSAETLYIRYHVCSLNDEADTDCDTILENFDAEDFEWVNEIEVTANEEGEFNHGSFVSAFAKAFEGQGKGCLMRHLAQSNWGKPDVELEDYDVLEVLTHCAANGNGDDDDDTERGRPAWAGTPGGPNASADDSEGKGRPAWAGTPGGPNAGNDD
jgi:hypothetical protein